jgi:hypothetical protein
MVKKRDGPLETFIKEGQIVFFEFPTIMKTSLEPKTIPAKALQVSIVNTVSTLFSP